MLEMRHVDPANDLGGLDGLFDVVAECDGHRPIGEHKYLDLLAADSSTPNGLVGTVANEIVAYVAVGRGAASETCALELALHPLHRSPEVIEHVINVGIDQVKDTCGGDSVRVWAFQPHFVGVLIEMGFLEERELRQLRLNLPHDDAPAFPADITVEAFRTGVDEAAWLEVNNSAFAGHPENGGWTPALLADREAQPWFEPEGFRMAWDGRRLAGFCWTKRQGDMGEIYVIAVAPDFQGRSLGRALALEGLRSLSERGMDSAMLYVDADNRVGLSLYESLGFRLDHIDRSLIRAV